MTLNGATILDKEIVMHRQRYGGLSHQVGNPVTQLVMEIHDEANFCFGQYMCDGEFCPSTIE